jgi:D-alanine-D-alanine ligase
MASEEETVDQRKIRVAVIFGGRGPEHSVSCLGAGNTLNAIDRDRYEVIPIGITTDGRWIQVPDQPERLALTSGELPSVESAAADPPAGEAGLASAGPPALPGLTSDDEATKELRRSEEGRQRLPAAWSELVSTVDVVLPIIHGPFGEDGSLQGLLEMAGVKYVGAGVLASAVGIDKEYMKLIFAARGLPVVPHVVVRERDWPLPGAGEATPESKRVLDAIAELGWPLFVKPARGGSSIGTSKASDMGQLHESIELARQFDRKVLVEAAVDGVEIEVSVLEGIAGGPPDTSLPGQMMIEGEDDFYDFGTKYLDPEDRMAIPAPIPAAAADEIRRLAAEAFEAVSCEGMARVDFFYTADGQVLINEINTLPGMTPTSYFQKLWEASGLPFDQLLDRVIQTALAKRPGLR